MHYLYSRSHPWRRYSFTPKMRFFMKPILTITAVLTCCLLAVVPLRAQDENEAPGLDKSPMDMSYYPPRAAFRAFEKNEAKRTAMAPVMRIIYSRPQAGGREVMGELVKYGEVWRLGANENAELQVYEPVALGGTRLEPGRYSLHAIPGEEEWTLIVNEAVDAWGSYSYDESKDVARISADVSETPGMAEAFTMYFAGDDLVIAWENTQVTVPVEKK